MAKAQAQQAPVSKGNVVLSTLKVEYMPIDSIKPNEYNPNRQSEHDFTLLCKSIDEDGMTQPIVVLRTSMVIVDGEHRWRACKALGYTEVPVVLTDMTPAQARIATLRHNRARGGEDVELAAAVLRDLAKMGATEWLKDSLEMDAVELENFLSGVDQQDGMSNEQAAALANADQDTLKDLVRKEGGVVEEHQTTSVQDVIRARETRLRDAKNEQERKKIEKDTSVYRLRLVFTGEEAGVVRKALGNKPVEKLLQICRDRSHQP